jgi:hypothetical protein
MFGVTTPARGIIERIPKRPVWHCSPACCSGEFERLAASCLSESLPSLLCP